MGFSFLDGKTFGQTRNKASGKKIYFFSKSKWLGNGNLFSVDFQQGLPAPLRVFFGQSIFFRENMTETQVF